VISHSMQIVNCVALPLLRFPEVRAAVIRALEDDDSTPVIVVVDGKRFEVKLVGSTEIVIR
jgi:hypothetical protein